MRSGAVPQYEGGQGNDVRRTNSRRSLGEARVEPSYLGRFDERKPMTAVAGSRHSLESRMLGNLHVRFGGGPMEKYLHNRRQLASGLPYQFDLPGGATVLGDKAFNHYGIEDDLASVGITLAPLRKKNSKRAIPPWETYVRSLARKYIETVGSCITRRFPKTIHAVTAAGFELKVVLFLLAYSIDCV